MNRFIVALTVLAALVAISEANNLRHKGLRGKGHGLHHGGHFDDFEEDYEDGIGYEEGIGHHGHHGGFGHRGGLGHRGGHGLGHHGGYGHHGHRGGLGHHHGGHGFGHGLGHGPAIIKGGRHGLGRGRLGRHGRRPLIRGSEGSFGGAGASSHLGNDKFIRGQQGSLNSNQAGFGADNSDIDFHDNEGKHKHQAFNNDKLIVSDKTNAVNDVDEFKNVDAHADRQSLGAGISNINAQEGSLEAGDRLNLDRNIGAVGGQSGELSVL